jgi:hypothetical protein
VLVLPGRYGLWLFAVLSAFGQVSLSAQLFLVAGRSATSAPATTAPASGLVSLGWNPGPDPNVTGYFLCWGLSSGACTNRLDAGNVTNTTVAGLAANVTYYFNVVAYGAAGQEAPPSNEVAYTVPADSPVGVGPELGVRIAGTGAGGALHLSFPGSAGATYDIQATQDFQHWATLWTTNCASAGLITFGVTDMADYPSRFYRLAQR